jgi:protoheme IX farnesyltransferase
MLEQSSPSLALPPGPSLDQSVAMLDAQPVSADRVIAVLRDVVGLAKPRLSSMVLFTTAGGLWLAPGHISALVALVTLVMTLAAVASANTLNCYLERETDGLMKRTRARALPTGRLDARVALVVGLVLAAVSVPALSLIANPLSGALAALAIASYVVVYTPMKQRTPWAVVVGAVPGAIPPLLGWAAVTNHLDVGGLALFGVMFIWQLPHFMAISLYLQEDYARGGIRVLPVTHGERVTRWWIVVTVALLVPMTLVLTPLHVAGWHYFVVAAALGLGLLIWAIMGLRGQPGARWARKFMLGTIAYLSLMFIALALDAT